MSQTPHNKLGQKMCKSPKNSNYQTSSTAVGGGVAIVTATTTIGTSTSSIIKNEKIDYENLSTNCTVVGSNNLNLVKKPQIVTQMSPITYNSNPSPISGGYPQSPYSSPASSLKSPSPNLKPPTPQPTNFPVMQIIQHNSHPTILTRSIQQTTTNHQPTQNIIKLKPHLNILPKPSASPQPSPKPSVSPQIVIPTNQPTATAAAAAIMPTAQPVLLNQMPMLTTSGVQFILRPQTTTKLHTTQMQAAATPQGLIIQPSGHPLLQLQPTTRTQPMVRVLTNGVQLGPTTTTTYLTNQPTLNSQQHQTIQPTSIAAAVAATTTAAAAAAATNIAHHNITINNAQIQQQQNKKKQKNKVKKKLDLANIMKLSGIGDEDDILFESDTSQSENEHNSIPNIVTQSQQQQQQQQHIVHTNTVQAHSNLVHTSDTKKIGNIQISAMAQPTINATATPVVQVLNPHFQSGMNSASQAAATAQASIPFNPFIAPNFTINNGLMLQRSGGFKLTMGEDGRLILQHDPTLNQDLQSQLILQSIFGLNGSLVLQPSMDQQIVQQTVQTIQQQSVQTIQQQTVQQTIQTVQPQPIHNIQTHHQPPQQQPTTHSIQSHVHQIQGQLHSLLQHQNQAVQTHHIPTGNLQNFQHHHHTNNQPVLKVQPFQKSQQPPVQTVHPIQALHHPSNQQQQQPPQQQQQQGGGGGDQTQQPPPTSYVVNLTPDQLEQLKRNGQLTVNGQTIFMQRPNNTTNNNKQNTNDVVSECKKLSPKIKPLKKVNKIQQQHQQAQHVINKNFVQQDDTIKTNDQKESKSSLICALQAPPKHLIQHQQNHVIQSTTKSSAIVQPSVQNHLKQSQNNDKKLISPQKVQNQQKVQPTIQSQQQQQQQQQQPNDLNGTTTNQDVEKLLGQLLDESNNINIVTTSSTTKTTTTTGNTNLTSTTTIKNQQQQPQQQQTQRIHTIQLTPQKQEHLKNIQLQIQNLSSRLTTTNSNNDNSEIHTALKLLFVEQQKILQTGKLLPPDKVYYHNNHLTIINPSSLTINNNINNNNNIATSTASSIQSKNDNNAVSQSNNNNSNNNLNNNSVVVRNNAVETSVHQVMTTQAHNNNNDNVPRISVSVPSNNEPTSQQHIIGTKITVSPIQQQQQQIHVQQQQQQQSQLQQQNTIAKKAHLIEAQLNLDQNGAVRPDIHTPFRDKKDACIRLVRYHCLDQAVLSEKDLDKADEIFELTARHFIGKYGKMVDKYKYLLMKESMRQVQTSELMMLDRMFLSEEQQSLMRLRQEVANETQLLVDMPPPPPPPLQQLHHPTQSTPHIQSASSTNTTTSSSSTSIDRDSTTPDDYDEWACIQKELGCLQQQHCNSNDELNHNNNNNNHKQMVAMVTNCHHQANNNQVVTNSLLSSTTNIQPAKRTASSDSRLETLKRFRVDKHNKKSIDYVNNSVNSSVQSVNNSSVIHHQQHQHNTHHQHHHHQHMIQSTTHHHHHHQHQNIVGRINNNNNSNSNTQYTIHNSTSTTTHEQLTQHENYLLENEQENNSIDEQVQSAIDSILNLQQSTQLDLDSILS